MDKRVVLITGGSSGIGRAIGIYLASRDYLVIGTTRDPSNYPGFSDFTLLPLEVRDPLSIQKAIDNILEQHGRIDVLINNAGVGISGPLEETPREEIHKVLDINLLGPVSVFSAVLPVMRRQGSGQIINITSIAGYMGLPYRGFYSASKGALILLTESLRLETIGSGIRISSLAPGDFATNIAAGRYHAPVLKGSPYELAYGNSLKMMNEHVTGGMDPERLAEKVHRILQTRHPRVHYTVGSRLQRFSLFLKCLLPDKLYEKLLKNHYKL